MKIKTRESLYEYILRQLGSDYINVEVSEDSLDDLVSDTIKEFSEFAFDGELEETVIVDVDGSGVYTLPSDIQTVIKVSQGNNSGSLTNFGANFGNGFVPDIWSEQYFSHTNGITGLVNTVIGISNTRAELDKFFGNDLAYDFNSHRKILRLFEPYTGKLLIHYTKEYIPEDIDYIYDATWVKRMCTAQARLIQSTVTGKYSQTLVGGGTINYSDMRSLAEQEIEQLREDLREKYTGPAPILVG